MNHPTCGGCLFWQYVEEKGANVQIGAGRRGNCYGVPPTPYAAKQDQFGMVRAQGNLRAVTGEAERACGLYTDRAQIEKMQREASGGAANEG